MDIILADVTDNLAMVFLAFRGLVHVLCNYCFRTENKLVGAKKHIFCIKTMVTIVKLYVTLASAMSINNV